MANDEHVAIFKRGVSAWNEWRRQNPTLQPDLSGADLSSEAFDTEAFSSVSRIAMITDGLRVQKPERINLSKIDLSHVNLRRTSLDNQNLSQANLQSANLTEANLSYSDLFGADCQHATLLKANLAKVDLCQADFSETDLRGANLFYADLNETNFRSADLRGTNLKGATLAFTKFYKADLSEADLVLAQMIDTNFSSAKLNGCRIFGTSAWNLETDLNTEQKGLIITRPDEPAVTVDNVEVAQFIHLLLNNAKLRDVIDTIGRKVVLILGRFTPERKTVLDAIREELRKQDYLPVMFDFQKPAIRSYRETVSILARLARFVIADITHAKVILQELEIIVSTLTSVPIQPILQSRARQNVVIGSDYSPYPWFLPTVRYRDRDSLITSLAQRVIAPAEARAKELTKS